MEVLIVDDPFPSGPSTGPVLLLRSREVRRAGVNRGAILVASCRDSPSFAKIRRSAIPPLTCDDARQRTWAITLCSDS